MQDYRKRLIEYTVFLISLFGVYLTSFYSFLLFHFIAEIFSIIIMGGVFLIGWNAQKHLDNSFFLILSVASIFIGAIDLVHTLAYTGMNIFVGYDSNLPTQLWIAARYLQAGTMLFASLSVEKKPNPGILLAVYCLLTLFLFVTIFTGIFPDCYVEGIGLTLFKIVSEYAINGILVVALAVLFKEREAFDKMILTYIMIAIISTIISEIAFMFYINVFGFSNIMGHIFKIIAFFAIYLGIIELGLEDPAKLAFQKLKQSETSLRKKKEDLEKLTLELDQIFNASLPLRIIDKDCRIIRVNDRFCDLLEMDEHLLLNQKCYEILPHDYCGTERCAMKQIQKGAKRDTYEINLTLNHDKKVSAIVNSVPYKSPEGKFLGIIQNYTNITRRKKAEEIIRINEERLRSLLRLSQLKYESEEEYFDFALEECVKITKSRAGYLHFLDQDEQTIELFKWSKEVLKNCEANPTKHYPIEEAGIWADCVRKRRPIIHNDYKQLNSKKGLPEGHFPMVRHMSLPIFDDERIIGVIGVGNKEAPYTEADVEQLSLYMDSLWRIIKEKRAGIALKRSEEKYATLFYSSPIGIGIARMDGKMITMNKAMERITQYAIDKYNRISLNDTYADPEEREKFISLIKKKKAVKNYETKLIKKDGSVYDALINSEIIQIEDEPAILTNLQDITDRKQAEERLEQFISTASHELRTPITVLENALNLLGEHAHQLKEGQKQQLNQNIRRNVKLLAQLVQDLLTISRMDEKKMTISFEQYYPRWIIEDIIKVMEPQIITNNLSIDLDMDEDLNLMGDTLKISQVFRILIDNAIKYSNEDSIIKIISIDNYKGEYNEKSLKGVLFQIEDEGIGIPKQDLSNVFDRFYRSEEVKKIPGSGLGLSIARELIKAHKGKIFIESEFGKGTKVSVFLPRIEKPL